MKTRLFTLKSASFVRWLLVIMVIALPACASRYKEQGLLNGYSHFQVSQDTFYVTYDGDPTTPAWMVRRYALIRAAQVTLENGYTRFVILSGHAATQGYLRPTPGDAGQPYAQAAWDASRPISFENVPPALGGTNDPGLFPRVELLIQCLDKADPGDTSPINAAEFLRLNPPPR